MNRVPCSPNPNVPHVIRSGEAFGVRWGAQRSTAFSTTREGWEHTGEGKAAPEGAALQDLAEFERPFAVAKLLECGRERSEVPLLGPVGKGRRLLREKRHLEAPHSKTWRISRVSSLILCLGLFLSSVSAGSAEAQPVPPNGVSWQSGPDFRFAPGQPVGETAPGLSLLPPTQTGILFTNLLPESRHLTNQILPNGSGVAAGDVDGDGWCDLFFCGLKSSGCQLYRNLGAWCFTNITAQAGVGCAGLDCTGAVLVDLDGDEDLDLIVNSLGGGTWLFFNDGHGHFTRSAKPLNPGRGGTSLGMADADGDGDLDLYIGNYRLATLTDAPGTRFSVKMVDGKPMVASIDGRPPTDPEWTNRFRYKFELGPGGRGKFGREELGEADAYFTNDGKGEFTAVSFTEGAFLDEEGKPLSAPFFDWCLSVLFRDLNGDGLPDLYLCNDFGTPDRFWLNAGSGRYRLAPALSLRQTSLASMAVDAADLDRDGYDDLVVVDMLSRSHFGRLTQRNIQRAELAPAAEITARPQYPRNTLLRNRGDGSFAEIAHYAGIEGTEWSWNPILLDVDLDGYEDLLVPNGFIRDNMNLDAMDRIAAAKGGRRLSAQEELQLRALYPPLNTPNLAFRNLGDLRFTECSRDWGFNQPVISQGACLADLDNDGDLDVVVNNLNSVAGIYRNDATAPRLAIRLEGRPPNTGGVGARITVAGGPVLQSQEIVSGGRYCSSDQAQRTFAAGSALAMTVRVRWRSGAESTCSNVPPNSIVIVTEPAGTTPSSSGGLSPETRHFATRSEGSAAPAFRFADVGSALSHRHVDASFDDFERQPLLPRRLSQLGPGVAWWDLDGDGREDLVVGSGRGGRVAFFRNLGRGRFERSAAAPWGIPVERDTAGLAGWRGRQLLVASAHYEDNATNQTGVTVWQKDKTESLLPLTSTSLGPLAVADYDGDGELDLFAGGRVIPGRYPVPGSSHLMRSKNGILQADVPNIAALPLGLVSGAIWADLEGDGYPELVLALDWGPVRILRNHQGLLEAWDPPVKIAGVESPMRKLSSLTGWWNGVAAGDFDNDGELDLVVSNWGGNTRYQRWRPEPLRLYYGDFGGDGSLGLLEAHFVPELRKYAPERALDGIRKSLPRLAEPFQTHAAWAEAGMEEVLGKEHDRSSFAEANWLETTLFLNRGDHFEGRILSAEAQFAPAFGLCVGDADGDGNEDLFLSQNFFGTDLDTSRLDAGRGLWLKGDGSGGLRPVPGHDSGVLIYGEQRGAALADFDQDGRMDLVVAQNSAETKLYRNTGAKPGLRVRLKGPPGNPAGLGTSVRLKFGTRLGPVRELHGGGGYESQDSPELVLATPEPPTAILVRWPGGHPVESPLPAKCLAVSIGLYGEVEADNRERQGQ